MILKIAISYALVLVFNVSHAAAQDTEGREPVPMAVGPQSSLYSVDGLALGAKVPFGSAAYRQYRCVRSEKFEGFVWCTKTTDNREARGPIKVWFSMLHAQNGVAVYVNRYQEPVHWGANEIPEDIQRYSKKIGEQPHIVQLPTRAGAPRGTIATWGKVVLEPITGDELRALADGKPPGEGIALDFIGDFARSARQGLPVYRIAGGAGFVWAGSYDERGRGTLRLSVVDASAYSPQALPTTSPSVVAVAPDEKATPVDASSSPQASPLPETTPPLPAVLPPDGVATAIDPPTLPPQETMPLPVTPLPPLPSVATAAASNDEVIARPLGSAEPATANSKLDVGVDGVGGYVCRIVGFVGAKFCADYMSVRYFVLLLIGIALASGIAMVRLGPALKGNGRSTALLLSEPSNHASDVKELQNSNVIVAAPQKADAVKGGGISTLARSPLFKRAMTDQGDNFPEAPICWACGGNINATDRFCSACGAPKKIYSQVTSQTSSSEIPSDTVFCPNCGSKVSNALQVLTSTDRSQEPNTLGATQLKELHPISEEPTTNFSLAAYRT
jgi:Double zinc ribbon